MNKQQLKKECQRLYDIVASAERQMSSGCEQSAYETLDIGAKFARSELDLDEARELYLE